jgi:hypothetical protein
MQPRSIGALGVAALALALTAGPAQAAAPSNDAFADALRVAAPGDYTGTVEGATAEAGEPSHAGSGPSQSVWFRYRARFTGKLSVDTIGSAFDTTLAAYTGDDVADLQEVASNDDDTLGGGPPRSQIRFTVRRGQTYMIALDSFAGLRESGAQAAYALHLSDGSIPGKGVTLAIAPGQTMAGVMQDGFRVHVANRNITTVGIDVRVNRATAHRLQMPTRVIAHGEGRLGWNDAVDADLQLTAAARRALRDEVVLKGSVRLELLGTSAPDRVLTVPFRIPS